MKIEVRIVVENDDTTISAMYINGKFQCWVLEDEKRLEKVPGETRIPAGSYEVGVRVGSPMAKRYDDRYKNINHRGMLWLRHVPSFKYIYFHTGNTDDHTDGCLVVGEDVYINHGPKVLAVGDSVFAYKKMYPMIRDAIDRGEKVTVDVIRNYPQEREKMMFIEGFLAGAKASIELVNSLIDMVDDQDGVFHEVSIQEATKLWEKKGGPKEKD